MIDPAIITQNEKNTFSTPLARKHTRILHPSDSEKFCLLRLEALRLDGRYYATSYEEERNYTKSQWQEWCTENDYRCAIGLFSAEELIGITTVIKWKEDINGTTALFGRSYITPEFRKQGLSSLLYGARLKWAKDNPKYDRAVVFHREGNSISEKINKRYGAKYWHTRSMQWADGQIANGIWYKIDLKKNN